MTREWRRWEARLGDLIAAPRPDWTLVVRPVAGGAWTRLVREDSVILSEVQSHGGSEGRSLWTSAQRDELRALGWRSPIDTWGRGLGAVDADGLLPHFHRAVGARRSRPLAALVARVYRDVLEVAVPTALVVEYDGAEIDLTGVSRWARAS